MGFKRLGYTKAILVVLFPMLFTRGVLAASGYSSTITEKLRSSLTLYNPPVWFMGEDRDFEPVYILEEGNLTSDKEYGQVRDAVRAIGNRFGKLVRFNTTSRSDRNNIETMEDSNEKSRLCHASFHYSREKLTVEIKLNKYEKDCIITGSVPYALRLTGQGRQTCRQT